MTEPRAPFWPFHVADFLIESSDLTTAEIGAYILLLCHYWHNGYLPLSDAGRRRVSRMRFNAWSIARPRLARRFAIEGDDPKAESEWRNPRLDGLREHALAVIETRRRVAQKAAAGRKGVPTPARESPPNNRPKSLKSNAPPPANDPQYKYESPTGSLSPPEKDLPYGVARESNDRRARPKPPPQNGALSGDPEGDEKGFTAEEEATILAAIALRRRVLKDAAD